MKNDKVQSAIFAKFFVNNNYNNDFYYKTTIKE